MDKINYEVTSMIRIVLFLSVVYTLQSCSKKSESGMGYGDKVEVQVSLGNAIFEELGEINEFSRSATPYLTTEIASSYIQREEIQLDENLFMTAELIPQRNDDSQPSADNGSSGSIKDIGRAATEVSPVAAGVRYRVVVYALNGNFVDQRDYIRGQEAGANPLLLDGDSRYIFIAYSVNSTVEPPPVTFTGNVRTLLNSNVTLTGALDFMYFRTEMTVSGNFTNYLSVDFTHRMSQITTTINSSALGYNVVAVTANFTPHLPTAVVPLTTGMPARSGAVGNSPVAFNVLGSQVVTSLPTIINSAANTVTNFVIPSLQIGTITTTGLQPFNNLTVVPGVKYNLLLTMTPNDIYLEHLGQSAVRINGQIWMRHNLGANTALNPDQSPSVIGLHGNYYQWGRAAVVADASTAPGIIPGYDNSTTIAPNSWNSGTETNPIKTAADPCPEGFRIPSRAEMDLLVSATISSTIGTWNESPTNYSAAKVLRSRRNANVQLTFPAAGGRVDQFGDLLRRAAIAFVWSSLKSTPTQAIRMALRLTTDEL